MSPSLLQIRLDLDIHLPSQFDVGMDDWMSPPCEKKARILGDATNSQTGDPNRLGTCMFRSRLICSKLGLTTSLLPVRKAPYTYNKLPVMYYVMLCHCFDWHNVLRTNMEVCFIRDNKVHLVHLHNEPAI